MGISFPPLLWLSLALGILASGAGLAYLLWGL